MSDKYNALIVTLGRDLDETEAERIMDAIRQMRNVIGVTANVADITSHVAERRAQSKLGDAIWDVIYPRSQP